MRTLFFCSRFAVRSAGLVGRLCQTPSIKTAFHRNALQFRGAQGRGYRKGRGEKEDA